jgi:hypothetical protein
MATQWYVGRGKVKEGPFSAVQLQSLAAAGSVQPSDMVFHQGSQRWLAAGDVPGLFGASPAVPPLATLLSLPPGSATPPLAIPLPTHKNLRLKLVAGSVAVVGLLLLSVVAIGITFWSSHSPIAGQVTDHSPTGQQVKDHEKQLPEEAKKGQTAQETKEPVATEGPTDKQGRKTVQRQILHPTLTGDEDQQKKDSRPTAHEVIQPGHLRVVLLCEFSLASSCGLG